jgi:PAS domain S-box-containing protein
MRKYKPNNWNFPKRYVLMPVILIFFILIFVLVYDDIKESTINEFNEEQLILAKTASQGIRFFFEEYQSNLVFLSRLPQIIEFNDETKTLLTEFYNEHKSVISGITRIDSQGVILYTYPFYESVIGLNISNQNHISQVIATKKPVVSDVFKSVQGYLAIAINVPVFKNEMFAGSLSMLVPVDKIGKKYLGEIKVRGTGNLWMLSEKGIELYCQTEEHLGKPYIENAHHDVKAIELFEKIKQKNSGTSETTHQEIVVNKKHWFNRQFITFNRAQIGNTYWTILISSNEKDIYSALTRLRNRLILVFLLLFVTISYYFYSITKVSNLLKEEQKRKMAENTLRESEERFRTIFNESPIGIELFKSDGLFVNSNKASLKMFGIPDVSETKNFNLFDGISLNQVNQEKLRRGESVSYQAIFDFEKIKELKFYKTNKTGKAYFDYIITPLKSNDGKKIEGYLLMVQDITERKLHEEELIRTKEMAEESDRLKSAFLANMSHEMRTPMNGILGFTDLLNDNNFSGEERQNFIEIIKKSGQRMLNTVNDLIDISKIETGQMKLLYAETDINLQVLTLYSFFEYQAQEKNLALTLKNNIPDDLVIVKTDIAKFDSILTNLIKNALKYTDTGTIEIGCSRNNNSLEFYVSDTGIGIPKHRQKAVFNRFVQADMKDSRAFQGSGLGLAIAKAYTEMLGGKIWMESEEGKGSTFYFTILAEKGSILKQVIPEIKNNGGKKISVKKLKILIAEDDEAGLQFLKAVLKNVNAEIICCITGTEVVEQCRKTPDTDIILMDIRMPEMNGYEATRAIRKFNKDVVIIAQTAFTLIGDWDNAINAGCNEYISKPIKRNQLLALIEKYAKMN